MLKNLLTLFKTIFPFEDFLYILQLEEYDNVRYLHRLPRFFFRRDIQKRDTLKFTSRIQTTHLLSIGIFVLSLSFTLINPIFLFVTPFLIPLYIALANNLLTPFYEFMKHRLQIKAANIVANRPDLQIIAIAGSYGKTTTKNFLYELVRVRNRTQMVPGNINTPTGIAAWILKDLNPQTKTLLVEMDAYFIGEIKSSCIVTPPDIAIITSIGDQHIERFGSVKKMAQAITEVFTYAKPTAQRFIFETEQEKLKKLNVKVSSPVEVIKQKKSIIRTNIESESAKADLTLALHVATVLRIPREIISDTTKNLVLPERRQKPTEINGYEGIDDSYNISATTAREGVSAAKAFAHKRKKKLLVITAGIPELGPQNKNGNREYGAFLAKEADAVIVMQSVFQKELMQDDFEVAPNFTSVWEKAKKFSPSQYVVLLQPELTDLYY